VGEAVPSHARNLETRHERSRTHANAPLLTCPNATHRAVGNGREREGGASPLWLVTSIREVAMSRMQEQRRLVPVLEPGANAKIVPEAVQG